MSSAVISTQPPQALLFHQHLSSPHSAPQQLTNDPRHPQQQRPQPHRVASSPAGIVPVPQPIQAPPLIAVQLHPNELRVIELIAALASQHHVSGYSKLKFGDAGCTAPYLPLSLVAPAHVHELRKRQAVNVSLQCFYPALSSAQAIADAVAQSHASKAQNSSADVVMTVLQTKDVDSKPIPFREVNVDHSRYSEANVPLPPSNPSSPSAPPADQTPAPPVLLRSRSEPTIHPPISNSLQDAITMAISSSILNVPAPMSMPPVNFSPPQVSFAVATASNIPIDALPAAPPPKPKTSDSHPINISYFIPPDWLPFISQHLMENYPTALFERSQTKADSTHLHQDLHIDNFCPDDGIIQFSLPPHLRFDAILAQHVHHSHPAAPHHVAAPSSTQPPSSFVHYHAFRIDHAPPQMKLGRPSSPFSKINNAPVALSTGPPPAPNMFNFQPPKDIQQKISDALQPLLPLHSLFQHQQSDVRGPARTSTASVMDEAPLPALPYPLVPQQTAPLPSVSMLPPPPSISPPAPAMQSPLQHTRPLIGNLLLSSCPGKKVRLTGPVKGRAAICRSVPQDIARIRSLNVGLIINCLDNSELEFLGAPWPEYSAAAQGLGIDVLRIPTPEGLAPLDTASLNKQIDWVIRTYTLRGINILVHCRGGVGRAGLVASCWAIKLGLCGPISEALAQLHEAHDYANATLPPSLPWPTLISHGVLRRETYMLVDRTIMAIRRRRSVKAIETYEQARFLMDYVEYLRECQEREIQGAIIEAQKRRQSSLESDSSRNSPCPSFGRSSESNTEETLVEMEPLLEDVPEDQKTPVAAEFDIQMSAPHPPDSDPLDVKTGA